MTSSFFGKFSSLLNAKNLKKFKDKLDPRLYNGAILLGLDKPVIKSHGSTDAFGFSNSLKVCEKTIRGNHIQYLNSWIKALKTDYTLIADASAQAQKAVDFFAVK